MESRCTSFFKIYLPQHNSHKLLIPPQFIKHFNEGIPEELELKNMCGNIWPVQLDITEDDKVFMSRGWEKYVKDHSLIRGDFLVFNKRHGSTLYVQVFGIDGCLKKEHFNNIDGTNQPASADETSSRGLAIETRAAEIDDVCSRSLQFYKTYRENFRCFVGVPKYILLACNYKTPQEIILRYNKGHAIKTHLRETRDRVVMGYVGLSEFWRKCNLKNGDKLQFTAILGEGRTIEVIEVSKTPEDK